MQRVEIAFFTSLNAFSSTAVHFQTASSRVNFQSGSVIVLKSGMKRALN
jgi:hypothetical protein